MTFTSIYENCISQSIWQICKISVVLFNRIIYAQRKCSAWKQYIRSRDRCRASLHKRHDFSVKTSNAGSISLSSNENSLPCTIIQCSHKACHIVPWVFQNRGGTVDSWEFPWPDFCRVSFYIYYQFNNTMLFYKWYQSFHTPHLYSFIGTSKTNQIRVRVLFPACFLCQSPSYFNPLVVTSGACVMTCTIYKT